MLAWLAISRLSSSDVSPSGQMGNHLKKSETACLARRLTSCAPSLRTCHPQQHGCERIMHMLVDMHCVNCKRSESTKCDGPHRHQCVNENKHVVIYQLSFRFSVPRATANGGQDSDRLALPLSRSICRRLNPTTLCDRFNGREALDCRASPKFAESESRSSWRLAARGLARQRTIVANRIEPQHGRALLASITG